MSFTQELTCRWSTSTWTPTRLLPARSFAQKLLHRTCYTGVQLTSRWSNCIWTPAKSDFSSSSISLWRQGQPGGGLRNVTLCGIWGTQTCGNIRVLFVLAQPSAEIVRVGLASMWCGEMRNFFARSNRLRRSCVSNAQACGGMWISFGHGQPSQRSRRSDIQTCGKMQIWWDPAQPLRTKWKSTVKNWCKIVILKVQMQAWHESQTAITVGKLIFNVRCKRSRIGVKLRLYPFWNVRHNRCARKKTCVKLRFYKVRRNPFTQTDCPSQKLRFSNAGCNPFARYDGWTSETYVKLRFFEVCKSCSVESVFLWESVCV